MAEYLRDGAFGSDDTEEIDNEIVDTQEFVYSSDEEYFHSEIDDLDLGDVEDGEKVVIYRGNPVRVTHMDFLKNLNLVETLQQMSYDEDGDMAEDYLMDVSEADEAEIIKEINKILCKYASQPGYYRVANIVPITITVGEFD